VFRSVCSARCQHEADHVHWLSVQHHQWRHRVWTSRLAVVSGCPSRADDPCQAVRLRTAQSPPGSQQLVTDDDSEVYVVDCCLCPVRGVERAGHQPEQRDGLWRSAETVSRTDNLVEQTRRRIHPPGHRTPPHSALPTALRRFGLARINSVWQKMFSYWIHFWSVGRIRAYLFDTHIDVVLEVMCINQITVNYSTTMVITMIIFKYQLLFYGRTRTVYFWHYVCSGITQRRRNDFNIAGANILWE